MAEIAKSNFITRNWFHAQGPLHASLSGKRHLEESAGIKFKPIERDERCRRQLLRLVLNKRHPRPPRRQPHVSQAVESREELKGQNDVSKTENTLTNTIPHGMHLLQRGGDGGRGGALGQVLHKENLVWLTLL